MNADQNIDKTQEKIEWMKTRNKNQKKLDELAAGPEEPMKAATPAEQCELTLAILEDMEKVAFIPGQQITPMPTAPDGSPLPPEMMDPAAAGMPPSMPMDPAAAGMPPMDPAAAGMPIDPNAMPMDPAMAGMPPDMPMDPAMGGAPMVDPATGMPIDPATGMPIDPATGMPMDPSMMEGEEGTDPAADADERLKSVEKQVGDLTDIVAGMQDESGSSTPAPSEDAAPAGEEPAPGPDPSQAPLTGASTLDAMSKLRTGQAAHNPDTLARVMGSMRGQ